MKRLVRIVVVALLGSLLFGFVVGTALRLRLERLDRPQRHLGRSERTPQPERPTQVVSLTPAR